MIDFKNMDLSAKEALHVELAECAVAFGGMNLFLQLIEAIRKTKPHPIISKRREFHFNHGSISWGKVIFNDKFILLSSIRINENKNGNLLPQKLEKGYKKVVNLVRTLAPIEFEVTPENKENGPGFKLKPFNIINKNTTRLNPIFDALFFTPFDTVKKILSFEVR